MKLFRTLLFAPGVRLELLTKSQGGQSDALIFDLEDSVPHNAKDEARRNVGQVLQEGLRKPMFLRINNPRAGDYQADLAVLASQASRGNVMGVILPKAEITRDIDVELAARLADVKLDDFKALARERGYAEAWAHIRYNARQNRK